MKIKNINKVIAAALLVLGFGGVLGQTGGCAYRGTRNYAPESDQRPTPGPVLTPGPIEILRPSPVAYGTPPPTFDPNKVRDARTEPAAKTDSLTRGETEPVADTLD